MPETFTVRAGERVAYSMAFLRSTGLTHSVYAHLRGVVTSTTSYGGEPATVIADVEWTNGDGPEHVNVANLAKVGPNSRFCAC